MTDEVAPRELTGTVTIPGSGETFNLAVPGEAAAAASAAGLIANQAKDVKKKADAVLRFHLEVQGRTQTWLGDFEVSETTGSPEYDADFILNGLIEAGMDPAAAEQLFVVERKVANGTELKKLATRVDAYAKVIEQGTKRKRGYIRTKASSGPAAPAPPTPVAIQQQVKTERAESQHDEDLGI